MTEVFVSIGSNVDREHNVREGLRRLAEAYGALRLSPVYETRAVGFEGDDFYNLVAAFETEAPPAEIVERLHAIEAACGRDRTLPRFGPRTLDIDLLLYGDQVIEGPGFRVPRDEITRYAFVLKPLADLAGARRHPEDGRTFAELWSALEADAEGLRPVAFEFTQAD